MYVEIERAYVQFFPMLYAHIYDEMFLTSIKQNGFYFKQ